MPRPKKDKYAEGREVFETLLEAYGEDELLQFINYRVMDGNTLTKVCEELMVPYPIIWEWIGDEMSRLKAYEQALKGLSDYVVHGMIEIANDSGDAKVRLDAAKWLASRWDRSRFGENVKVEVNHSVSLISLLSSLKDLPDGTTVEGEVLEDKSADMVLLEAPQDVGEGVEVKVEK